MDKFCICGARVECDSGGYTCPRCFRRYSTQGKLINSFSNSLIEFDERATQMDDTTMHYGDEEESCHS